MILLKHCPAQQTQQKHNYYTTKTLPTHGCRDSQHTSWTFNSWDVRTNSCGHLLSQRRAHAVACSTVPDSGQGLYPSPCLIFPVARGSPCVLVATFEDRHAFLPLCYCQKVLAQCFSYLMIAVFVVFVVQGSVFMFALLSFSLCRAVF